MSPLRLSLLLLTIALIATTTYTQEVEAPEYQDAPVQEEEEAPQQDEEFKCTHGEQDFIEPELADIEEDWNPEGNNHEGRTLASYGNLRTKGYYGFLKTSVSYYQNDLIPPILDYFSHALKVKYPVSGLLKVTQSSVCGKSTPSVLRSGVTADYVLMIETYSASGTTVAATQVCTQASGTRRPLVAYARVNSAKLAQTKNILLHEKNMICMIHEITHSLGFTSNMYSSFLNANGQRQSGIVKSGRIGGITTTVLAAEPLRTMLRNHFGCSSLAGAYMENTGGAGTTGHHFERRIFAFEYMTSGLIYNMQISKFTLGLLESSGWYVPDYSYADEFHWGKGQGCNFVTGSCSSSSFKEFCSSSGKKCTNVGRGAGSCSTDSRSDSCKWIHPNVNYDCDNPSGKNSARLPSAETYSRGANSKCFEGTLGSSSSTAFCFKYSCSGSGASTRLTVNVGSKSAVCTKAGSISVSGYTGKINCPNPQTFCTTIGRKVCPRGCMGRGTCNNGKCACRSGYKGADCALRSAF